MEIIKRLYITPMIEKINLDNKISLALESTPPEGPVEGSNNLNIKNYGSAPFNTDLT